MFSTIKILNFLKHRKKFLEFLEFFSLNMTKPISCGYLGYSSYITLHFKSEFFSFYFYRIVFFFFIIINSFHYTPINFQLEFLIFILINYGLSLFIEIFPIQIILLLEMCIVVFWHNYLLTDDYTSVIC